MIPANIGKKAMAGGEHIALGHPGHLQSQPKRGHHDVRGGTRRDGCSSEDRGGVQGAPRGDSWQLVALPREGACKKQ